MFASVQSHLGEICLVLVSLIGVSEGLPFFDKVKANGILHGVWIKVKGAAIEEAKKEIDKQEKGEKAPE